MVVIMNEVCKRLNDLRNIMEINGVQAYIVCTNDFHGSEYIGEYFKTREFMSGFTGSAGTLVVLKDKAALWTDGRYFIQAEAQLENSTIELMKAGNVGVKSIPEFLNDELNDGDTIGFDGRTVSNQYIKNIADKLGDKNIKYKYDKDLVGLIWKNRPKLPEDKVFELDIKYSGESAGSKLTRVIEKISEYHGDVMVVTALDEIAWLLNLRGNDIKCCPVFLSYMIIGKEKSILYIDSGKISEPLKSKLIKNNVYIKEYDEFYDDLKVLNSKLCIILDRNSVNYYVSSILEKNENLIYKDSPIQMMKAVKNQIEIENMRKAHIKDGVAVTHFIYYLKQNAGNITETQAAVELEKYREKGNGIDDTGYIEPSFDPIIAYGPHGAIVHYSSTKETDVVIEKKGLLLADTGGHYYEGTTDITRTIAMGPLTAEEKKAFTIVLKGNLNLGAKTFLKGITGKNLDICGRSPLWDEGINYNHGTGHGVGYLLNVHEGPNCFRWQSTEGGTENTVFEEGMITSNEPGVYIEGKFGIRHENLILCKKIKENEFGTFLGFETLTMVPFDLEAIDIDYLNDYELELLNEYHRMVFNNISKYFQGEELEWLMNATRKVEKTKC